MCICVEDGELKIELVMGEICCDSDEKNSCLDDVSALAEKEQPEDCCEEADFVPIKVEGPFVTTNYNGFVVNDQFASDNHLSHFYNVLNSFVSVVASLEGLSPPPLCIPQNKFQIHSQRTVILQV
ncbi:MAG: hypothetical protein ACUZ8E_03700 [Candidatus Anammoxibacter sp.]